jgi:hypothetical protein
MLAGSLDGQITQFITRRAILTYAREIKALSRSTIL